MTLRALRRHWLFGECEYASDAVSRVEVWRDYPGLPG